MWKQSMNVRDEVNLSEGHWRLNTTAHAKISWRLLHVTYFACDPLHSYLDEPQRNEIYFLKDFKTKPNTL